MSDFIIRPLLKTDSKKIADFFAENFSDGWTEGMIVSAFDTSRFHAKEFGEMGDGATKTLGVITYSITDGVADIEDIVVSSSARRNKVGSSLMENTLNELQKEGVKRVMLEVREGNAPAIGLYRKFGFKDLAVRKKYYQDGENALIMEKEF